MKESLAALETVATNREMTRNARMRTCMNPYSIMIGDDESACPGGERSDWRNSLASHDEQGLIGARKNTGLKIGIMV
jgi:hypothetical protein